MTSGWYNSYTQCFDLKYVIWPCRRPRIKSCWIVSFYNYVFTFNIYYFLSIHHRFQLSIFLFYNNHIYLPISFCFSSVRYVIFRSIFHTNFLCTNEIHVHAAITIFLANMWLHFPHFVNVLMIRVRDPHVTFHCDCLYHLLSAQVLVPVAGDRWRYGWSESLLLIALVSDIPKVTLNLQWPSPM